MDSNKHKPATAPPEPAQADDEDIDQTTPSDAVRETMLQRILDRISNEPQNGMGTDKTPKRP